jgi:Domain of unknown function (DUF202)
MATLRRTEAKAFFANERTFLHWMNMSVTLGSISAALLGELYLGNRSEREGTKGQRDRWRKKKTHLLSKNLHGGVRRSHVQSEGRHADVSF